MTAKLTIELFYIGSDFYMRSGTHMSSIYMAGTYERYDWGFVQVELQKGTQFFIRQATQEELTWAQNKLRNYEQQSNNQK